MSRRQLRADDVDGFVLAIWDEIKDTEETYGARCLMDLRLGDHRGHISAHVRVVREDAERGELLVGSADVQWPSHHSTSLHALLFRLAIRANLVASHEWAERSGLPWGTPPPKPA